MSLEIRIDGVLIENRVRLTGGSQGGVAGFPAAAYYGQIMTAGVRIDDPTGTLDVRGWHVFTADETSCSKPRIFTGWITGTNWTRPPEGPNIGPGRVIDCDIMDQNALFGFEVFRSTAASIYPAQTDLARIEQARASHAMAGTPIVDNGRVSSDNPVNLTDVNFVGRYPGELFTSTAGEAGKQFYAYYDDTANEISLHYAPVGEGPAASWGVSNVISDVDDDTVFFPMTDGAMARSPDDVNTGLLFGYAGGRWVYTRNQDLIDDLSPTELSPINFLRDKVYQTDRVGLTSTANALAQTYLANMSTEDEVITFTVRVPAAKVNLAHAGDLIPLKFTHLEGYETSISRPVLRRNVIPSPGRRDMYDITFECSGEATQVGPGGGTGGETPEQDNCDVGAVTILQSGTIDLDSSDEGDFSLTPTAGSLMVLQVGIRPGIGNPMWTPTVTGWTPVAGVISDADQGYGFRMFYRITAPGTTTFVKVLSGDSTEVRVQYIEVTGIGELDSAPGAVGTLDDTGDGTSPSVMSLAAVTPTADRVAFIAGGLLLGVNVGDSFSSVPGSGWTEAADEDQNSRTPMTMVYQIVDGTTGSYTPTITATFSGTRRGHIGNTAVFVCSGSDIPSIPHIQVPPRPPTGDIDGSNTDFETDPFDDESLRVLHDGIDQSAHVTAYDGAAGTFTLNYAPSAGSTLRVGTQAR